jgi:hypothetical protein
MKARATARSATAYASGLVLFVTLALLAAPARAQEPLVIPRLTGPIELDGLSDEAAWEAIAPLPATMQTPTFGQAPSERTEFRVAYDDDYLYASGRLYDSDPGGIQAASLKRDDGSFSNDWFVVQFDTFRDRETALGFGTNPAGIRTDVVFANDGQSSPNFNWNTFWDSAVRQTDEGWFAEIRIPLSSLRFQERDGQVVMGMSLWRRIARKNEMITYPAIPPRWGMLSVAKASQMQEIVLEGIRRRRPVYATPYLLGGVGRSHALNTGKTAYDPAAQNTREAGLDLKYGLTSNLTLDLTYNTDFAQVEADDQQVNLTRFSLFFPEKRLFFQERGSVFDFSTGQSDRLFYSRRIGLTSGRQVPIHGGARLVGRVGAWDVGVLNMQTAELDGIASENFGVARARRQVLNQNSYVGGILTRRSGSGDTDVVYGLDGLFRVFGQDYLTLNWSQSSAGGESDRAGAMDRALMRARWERRGIDGLTYAFDASRVGDVFDPSMGFLLRHDYTRLGDQIAYGWRAGKSSPLLRQMVALKGFAYRRNADGSTESAEIGPEWLIEAKSGHTVTLKASTAYEDLEREFKLAGQATVPLGSYSFQSAGIEYGAPGGALLRSNAALEAGSFYDGWQATGSITPTWNVSRHLEVSGLYQMSHVSFPDRGQEFTAQVARLRTRVMLNTRFSVAGFVQYNSAVDAAYGNLRLRYNPREGDDLYLVYNAGVNTDRYGFAPVRPLLDNHVLMIKYSRTVGLTF